MAKILVDALVGLGLSHAAAARFANEIRSLKGDKDYCSSMFEGIGNGGHMADLHFSMDPCELQARVQNKSYSLKGPFCASQFYSSDYMEIADMVVKTICCSTKGLEQIVELMKGEADSVALYKTYPEPIGEGAFTGADMHKLYPLSRMCVVLKRADYEPFYIHTAYPMPTAAELLEVRKDIKKFHPWLTA